VRQQLHDVTYLADDGIAGVVFLADRLGKPVLVEDRPAPARPSWPRASPR
jgi:hypothetical protein